MWSRYRHLVNVMNMPRVGPFKRVYLFTINHPDKMQFNLKVDRLIVSIEFSIYYVICIDTGYELIKYCITRNCIALSIVIFVYVAHNFQINCQLCYLFLLNCCIRLMNLKIVNSKGWIIMNLIIVDDCNDFSDQVGKNV